MSTVAIRQPRLTAVRVRFWIRSSNSIRNPLDGIETNVAMSRPTDLP